MKERTDRSVRIGRPKLGIGWFGGTERAIEDLSFKLDQADPTRLALLAEDLVRLGKRSRGERAWDELAMQMHRLTQGQRERVLIAGQEMWGACAARLAKSAVPERRIAAARLAGWCEHPTCVIELAGLLSDREPRVTDAAIRSLCAQVTAATSGIGVGQGRRLAIETALVEALNQYDQHRRREVLHCAIEMVATPARRSLAGPALQAFLADHQHHAHMPVRGVLRSGLGKTGTDRPVDGDTSTNKGGGVRAAFTLLSTQALQGVCVERLFKSASSAEFNTLLSMSHLLKCPARGRVFARAANQQAPEFQAILGDVRFIHPDSATLAARVPAVLATIGSGEAWNASLGLLADPRPRVRSAMVRSVVSADGPADVLVDAALDVDHVVARSAMLAAASPRLREYVGRQAVAKLCASLQRSEDRTLRELATSVGPHMSPWHPDHAASRALARRMLRRDREGFVLSLRRRIIEGEPKPRLDAIRMAHALGIAPLAEAELLGLARSAMSPQILQERATPEAIIVRQGELRVVATGISVLGEIATPAAREAVLSACGHPDARVRSNALDALWRLIRGCKVWQDTNADLLATIVEFKHDTHHRVRASALRAELTLASSGDDRAVKSIVLPMLTDERPMHRVAGVWLAEKAAACSRGGGGFDGISGMIATMIGTDPSPEVRRRACRCAERLLARGVGEPEQPGDEPE